MSSNSTINTARHSQDSVNTCTCTNENKLPPQRPKTPPLIISALKNKFTSQSTITCSPYHQTPQKQSTGRG